MGNLFTLCKHCGKPEMNCDCDGPFEPDLREIVDVAALQRENIALASALAEVRAIAMGRVGLIQPSNDKVRDICDVVRDLNPAAVVATRDARIAAEARRKALVDALVRLQRKRTTWDQVLVDLEALVEEAGNA